MHHSVPKCADFGHHVLIFPLRIYKLLSKPHHDEAPNTHNLENEHYLMADRLLCLSAYPTGCLLPACCMCFGILHWLALHPCFSVSFLWVLCLSAYVSTSLPTCLFGSVSSHPPRLTPDNATWACNRGLQQYSMKVTKKKRVTGQAADSSWEINAVESQWQGQPAHSCSLLGKASSDTVDFVHMSVHCTKKYLITYWVNSSVCYNSCLWLCVRNEYQLFWCQMAATNTPNKHVEFVLVLWFYYISFDASQPLFMTVRPAANIIAMSSLKEGRSEMCDVTAHLSVMQVSCLLSFDIRRRDQLVDQG